MTEPERRATLKTGEKRRSAPLVLAEALILLAILALAGVLLRQGYRRYMETVYPLKYAAFVNRAAEEYDFEPSLLFAMIYTESGFDPEAVSVAPHWEGQINLLLKSCGYPPVFHHHSRSIWVYIIFGSLSIKLVNASVGSVSGITFKMSNS